MARFIRASYAPYAAGCRSLTSGPRLNKQLTILDASSWTAASSFVSRFRTFGSVSEQKSPMEANLIRLLRSQIQYQLEYAPRDPPETEIGVFEVTDKPGEEVITLTAKHGENEEIRIEATMFDCCVIVPLTGEGPSRGEERRHLSLRVHIAKGDGSYPLTVICSSWPEYLDVQRFFVASDLEQQRVKPYMGRYFKALDRKLQKSFYDFLEERGINCELSFLLHAYMKNKQKIAFTQWLGKAQSFVEQ
ncbi:unnamed protein product [Rhodiola kirilowii]